MDDVDELYSLFPELKEQIVVEKKVGQGLLASYFFLLSLVHDQTFNNKNIKY